MKKHKKIILKVILFLIIFIILFGITSIILVRKGNGYGTDIFGFYAEKRNSINILYLGSSHAYSSFNPYLIEEKTNLNGYVFATQQQPIWITYHHLIEALKYQKPKYVVLEVHMVAVQDKDYADEQVNRDAIDKMRPSKNKLDVIKTSVKEDKLTYYFNIMKYHTRYKELKWIDFATVILNYSIDNKGYTKLPNQNYIYEYNNEIINDEVEKITEKNELYLNKIINLCKEKNIELIFVKTPCDYTEDNYKKLNYISELAKQNEILFLNYIENIDELNLDYTTDFYDSGHLNESGSNKLSEKFSIILNQLNGGNE